MAKGLLIFLGVSTLVCCGGGGYFAYVLGQQAVQTFRKASRDAEAYAVESLKAISANWSVEEFKARADDDFLRKMGDPWFESFVARHRDLGPYRSHKLNLTSFNAESKTGEESRLRVRFEGEVDFARAKTDAEIGLVLRDRNWKLEEIRLTPRGGAPESTPRSSSKSADRPR